MKTILTPILILFVFIISSCEGPQGEPGPQGAAGTPGAQGQTGPAGPTGKISFYSTGWIEVGNKFWIDGYDAATLTSIMALENGVIGDLTQADLDGGIVLVYDTYYEDKSAINALPYDFVFGGDNHVWFSYGAGIVEGKKNIDLYATFAKNVDPKSFLLKPQVKICGTA